MGNGKRGKEGRKESWCVSVYLYVCVRERGCKDIESVGAPVVCVCARVCACVCTRERERERERELKKSFLKIPSDF